MQCSAQSTGGVREVRSSGYTVRMDTTQPAPVVPPPVSGLSGPERHASKVLIGIAAFLLVGGVVAYQVLAPEAVPVERQVQEGVRIGFSLGTIREERWQRDIDLFTERARELGAAVVPAYANDNPDLQLSQAEDLILQGVDALVVVAQDGQAAADIVTKAHAAGIPVLAYDRLIAHPELDLFVTFDSRVVGELEAQEIVRRVPKGVYAYIGGSTTDNNAFLHKEGAMRVLKPLIDSGDITLAVDSFSPGWRPDEAYKTMQTYLATGKTVDAVVAANDGTAGGVVQALEEKDLAGKVPVAGQDADLAACQRIVAGTQAATVYKPIHVLAAQAATDAVALARGTPVATGATIANGSAETPARLLTPTLVTSENLEGTVVKDGFHSRDAVFQ